MKVVQLQMKSKSGLAERGFRGWRCEVNGEVSLSKRRLPWLVNLAAEPRTLEVVASSSTNLKCPKCQLLAVKETRSVTSKTSALDRP